jgi:hypothetical protein
MSLKNMDIGSALRRLAEKRIEDAMKEGKFDNLPGAGKPLELEPIPADENARMTWWALKIMRNNEFTPHEVRWRKTVDHLKADLAKLTDESRLEPLVKQINDLVHQINTLGTNAINLGMVGVDLETARAELRQRINKPS